MEAVRGSMPRGQGDQGTVATKPSLSIRDVMATWKRMPWTRLRAAQVRGFWSQGKQEVLPGKLFGETPPPPGQSRKWESWELP